MKYYQNFVPKNNLMLEEIWETFGRSLKTNLKILSSMKSKKITGIFSIAALAAIFAVAGIAQIPQSDAAISNTYKVTVTNITPGQPITPPLLVTHSKDVDLFSVGTESSTELAQLAENGNFEPLVQKLSDMEGVGHIVTGKAPLVPANDSGETGLAYSEAFTIPSTL